MPKIPIFNAGEGKLTPPEAGASALSRAASVESRAYTGAAAAVRQEGEMFKQGIDSLGSAVSNYTAQAQAHTDAMQETEADAQILQNKFDAQGIVSGAGTPKDGTSGAPITNYVGVGGDQGLPPDAQVLSSDQFAVVADKTITQHQAAGQSIIDRLTGQGVSPAAQERIKRKVMNADGELQLHAAAVANENATTRVVHQTDASLRALETNTNQFPNNLDDNLKQGSAIYKTLTQHGTGDAAKRLNDLAVTGEEAFRERTVRQAVEAIVRKGGDGAVAEATKVMDAHAGDVKDRDGMVTHLTELANQGSNAARLAAAEKVRTDHAAMDAQSGKALAAGQPVDMTQTTLGQQYPEKAGQLNQEQLAHREYSLKMNQPDPQTSYQNGQKLLEQGLQPGANPEATKAAAQAALISKDPAQRISVKDYEDIKKTLDDPNLKTATTQLKNWMKLNETRIDPFINTQTGTLPGGHTPLGNQQIQAFTEEYQRRYAADPAHAWQLLDKDSPNSMVSDKALQHWRVTDQMQSDYAAKNLNLDDAADKERAGPQPIDSRGWIQRTLGINAPEHLGPDDQGRVGGPTAAPVQFSHGDLLTKGITTPEAALAYAIKTYRPGQILTDTSTGKTYVVPGQPAAPVQKMNYTPDRVSANTAPASNLEAHTLTGYNQQQAGAPVTGHNPTAAEQGGTDHAGIAAAVKTAAPAQVTDLSTQTGFRSRGQMSSVSGMIIHHTGGGGTVNGVISTLKERGLSVQYVVDRDGKIFQLMPDGQMAAHIMNGWGAKGAGKSNHNMQGVEVIARNNKDVTPAQVKAVQALVARQAKKFGYDPKTAVFGHGEVNPGHKEASEGMAAVDAIRGGSQVASQ
jgi:hypothetical protein